MSNTTAVSIQENNEQIDFFRYFTPTNFDSPEVIREMEFVRKEIQEVLDGMKIDPSKMLTIFQLQKISKTFVQEHSPVFFCNNKTYLRYFEAGFIASQMINYKKK